MRLPWRNPRPSLDAQDADKRDRALLLAAKVKELATELEHHTDELLQEVARSIGEGRGAGNGES